MAEGAVAELPPPPPGFVPEETASAPKPPPGFVPEASVAAPKPPPGFVPEQPTEDPHIEQQRQRLAGVPAQDFRAPFFAHMQDRGTDHGIAQSFVEGLGRGVESIGQAIHPEDHGTPGLTVTPTGIVSQGPYTPPAEPQRNLPQQLSMMVGESAPVLLTGPAAPAVAGLQAAGHAREDVSRRRAQGQQISGGQELAYAGGSGAIGAATAGVLGKGAQVLGKVTPARDILGRVIANTVLGVGVGEGSQIAENATARATNIDPDRPLTQGTEDARRLNAIQGLGFSALHEATSARAEGAQERAGRTQSARARIAATAKTPARFHPRGTRRT
jgi:hypothetical protein